MKSLMGPAPPPPGVPGACGERERGHDEPRHGVGHQQRGQGLLRDDRDVLAANPVLKRNGAGTSAPFVGSGASLGVTKLEWEIAV